MLKMRFLQLFLVQKKLKLENNCLICGYVSSNAGFVAYIFKELSKLIKSGAPFFCQEKLCYNPRISHDSDVIRHKKEEELRI